jgi:hypothetical protein
VTLPGIGILLEEGAMANDVALVQHEFGHYLDYLLAEDIMITSVVNNGPPILGFYNMIGLPSLFNAATGVGGNHKNYWTETRANDWAKWYFGNSLSDEFGPGKRFPTSK